MKRYFKWGVVACLATSLCFGSFSAAGSSKPTFSDIANSSAKEEIVKMTDARIIDGYVDGTFRPNTPITRSEFIKIMNRTKNYTDKVDSVAFKDVKANDWYYNELLIAMKAGYINGYPNGNFGPTDHITREQFCKVISSTLDILELPYDQQPTDYVSSWAKPYVQKVLAGRVMSLETGGKFRATEPITRGEVCKVLANHIETGNTGDLIDTDKNNGGTPGGSIGPGGGNSGNPNDKPNNPGNPGNPDKPTIPNDIYEALVATKATLVKSVIPALSTDKQKEICQDIYNNMDAYLKDPTYKYEDASKDVIEKYNNLSETERKELKEILTLKINSYYLKDLQAFFFPDMDISI